MQVWYPSPGADPFKQEDFLQVSFVVWVGFMKHVMILVFGFDSAMALKDPPIITLFYQLMKYYSSTYWAEGYKSSGENHWISSIHNSA